MVSVPRSLLLTAGAAVTLTVGLPAARADSPREMLPGVHLLGGTLNLGDRGSTNAIYRDAGTPQLPPLVARFGFGVDGALSSGLALGFDFIFDHWGSNGSGLLGVTMGPSVGWVLFTSRRWTLLSQAGLAFGATRLTVHGGPLFEPAPGNHFSLGARAEPRDHHRFVDVASDPGTEALFQSISLTASAGFTALYGDRQGGLYGGVRLGFQAPLAREDWELRFERHVGSAPNVPTAGANAVLLIGYRFSGLDDPPQRRAPSPAR